MSWAWKKFYYLKAWHSCNKVKITIVFTAPAADLLSGLIGRRRLLAVTVPATEIENPVICGEIGEMIIFKLLINDTDRTKSHYPVYSKDHLFSTNPNFDYSMFTQLKDTIESTNANISNFAYVFTDSGNFVFYDAQDTSL